MTATRPAASVVPCAHCGADVATTADEGDTAAVYCCAGCEIVATIVAEHGWERFYAERDGYSPRPEAAACAVFDGEAYAREHIAARPGGLLEARLRVGGVRCAACVWLCEKALAAQDGVVDAHVSYGTNIATVRWDPSKTRLSALAAMIARLGYTPLEPTMAPRADRDDLVRLGIAAFCTMNVMLIHVALYLGDFSGDMAERHTALFAWASLVLATPTALIAALPFYRGSWQSLRHGVLSMDVPIALAIVVMFVHGALMARHGEPAYLDSLTMLVTFLLGGRVLVARGRDRATAAAEAVLANAPTETLVRVGDQVRAVPSSEVKPGDRIVVGSGARICADGVVAFGGAQLDASHVTGESTPVAVEVGSRVVAGAAVVTGQIEIDVEAVAAESTVARIGTLVKRALDQRSVTVGLLDRVAPKFTAGVLVASSLTFGLWWFFAGLEAAIPVVVAVLVVACPCALALAAPTTMAVGIGAAARRGAFVRSPDALTALARVDHLAIDKTGTLTFGVPRVLEADDATLALAAAVEIGDRHPVARAIVDELDRRGLPIARASEVCPIPGGGVRGMVDGRRIEVFPSGPERASVSVDGVEVGAITFRDRVRDDAAATLQRLGLPVTLLSGDHPDVVRRIAREVGIDDTHGGLRPEQKAAWVAAAESDGARVVFVGDGVNDAPAMARASIGVAMGEGAAAAIETADVVIFERSLAPLRAAREAALAVDAVFRLNARVAVTYNVSAVLFAAAGFVTPLVAAILMPISSLVVVTNALGVERRVRRSLANATDDPSARRTTAAPRAPMRGLSVASEVN